VDPSARALRRPAAEQIGRSLPTVGEGATSKSRKVFFTVHPSDRESVEDMSAKP